MCPDTLEGLRVLRYMFQDLTLASSIQKLTLDENIGNGFVDMVDVKSIRDILQAKVGVENKATLTVRLDGVSNQLLMKSRADHRFEYFAPLAMDHHTDLLSLVDLRFYHCHFAELDIRNCCVDFSWLKSFVRYSSTTLGSVSLENIRMLEVDGRFSELQAALLDCSGLQHVRFHMLHDDQSSRIIFMEVFEMHEGGGSGRMRDFIEATDFGLAATPDSTGT
ncbi:hypothetical protein D6D29_10750 [Aureobasidium pullulans]|nr:hypothetical protein D6D29_10750 [Aureobasidium pullulans]